MRRKKLRTPVLDECRLEALLSEITSLDGIEITPDARITLPDGATFDQQLRILHGLVDSYNMTNSRSRFLIGNFVNALSHRHGDKARIIEKEFPPHEYNRIRKFARVAAAWGWNPGLTWGWSWYDETAKLKHDDQLHYLAKWQQGGYTILDFRSEWQALHPVAVCPTSDKPNVSDSPNPTHPNSNTQYIGFGTLAALQQALKQTPTLSDIDALQQSLDARRSELQDDTDDFADEEESQEE